MIAIGDYIKIKEEYIDEIVLNWVDNEPEDIKVIGTSSNDIGLLYIIDKYYYNSENEKHNVIFEGFVEKNVYKSRINLINNFLNDEKD